MSYHLIDWFSATHTVINGETGEEVDVWTCLFGPYIAHIVATLSEYEQAQFPRLGVMENEFQRQLKLCFQYEPEILEAIPEYSPEPGKLSLAWPWHRNYQVVASVDCIFDIGMSSIHNTVQNKTHGYYFQNLT